MLLTQLSLSLPRRSAPEFSPEMHGCELLQHELKVLLTDRAFLNHEGDDLQRGAFRVGSGFEDMTESILERVGTHVGAYCCPLRHRSVRVGVTVSWHQACMRSVRWWRLWPRGLHCVDALSPLRMHRCFRGEYPGSGCPEMPESKDDLLRGTGGLLSLVCVDSHCRWSQPGPQGQSGSFHLLGQRVGSRCGLQCRSMSIRISSRNMSSDHMDFIRGRSSRTTRLVSSSDCSIVRARMELIAARAAAAALPRPVLRCKQCQVGRSSTASALSKYRGIGSFDEKMQAMDEIFC